MKLLLDTNRYADLARGISEVVARAEAAEQVLIPLIVLGELRAGFLGGSRGPENEAALTRFLSKPTSSVLIPDLDTSMFYARVVIALREKGRLIPTNDMWIAAQALQHDLTLDTRDEHFQDVPGLKLV